MKMFTELYSLQSPISVGSYSNAVRCYHESRFMGETFAILRNEVTTEAGPLLG